MPPKQIVTLTELQKQDNALIKMQKDYLGDPNDPMHNSKLITLKRHKQLLYDAFLVSGLGISTDEELQHLVSNKLIDLKTEIERFAPQLTGIITLEAAKAALAMAISEKIETAAPETREIIDNSQTAEPWMQVQAQIEPMLGDLTLAELTKLYKLPSDAAAEQIMKGADTNPVISTRLIEKQKKLEELRAQVNSSTTLDPTVQKNIVEALTRIVNKVDNAIDILFANIVMKHGTPAEFLPRVTDLLQASDGTVRMPKDTDDVLDIIRLINPDLDREYKRALLIRYPDLDKSLIAELDAAKVAPLSDEAKAIEALVAQKKEKQDQLTLIEQMLKDESFQMNAVQNNDLDVDNSTQNRATLERLNKALYTLDQIAGSIDSIDAEIKTKAALAPDNIKYLANKTTYLAEWARDLAVLGHSSVKPQADAAFEAKLMIDDALKLTADNTREHIKDLIRRVINLKTDLEIKVAERFAYLDKVTAEYPKIEAQITDVIDQRNYDTLAFEKELENIQETMRKMDDKDAAFPALELRINDLRTKIRNANKTLIGMEGEMERISLLSADLFSTTAHSKRELARIVANKAFEGKLQLEGKQITSIQLKEAQDMLSTDRNQLNRFLMELEKSRSEYSARVGVSITDAEDLKVFNSRYADFVTKEKGMWLKNKLGELYFRVSTEAGPFIVKLDHHPAQDLLDGNDTKVIDELTKVLKDNNFTGDINKLIAQIIASVYKDNYDVVPYDIALNKLVSSKPTPDLRDLQSMDANALKDIQIKYKDSPIYKYLDNRLQNLTKLRGLVMATGLDFNNLNPIAVAQAISQNNSQIYQMKSDGATQSNAYKELLFRANLLNRVAAYLGDIDDSYYTRNTVAPVVTAPVPTPVVATAPAAAVPPIATPTPAAPAAVPAPAVAAPVSAPTIAAPNPFNSGVVASNVNFNNRMTITDPAVVNAMDLQQIKDTFAIDMESIIKKTKIDNKEMLKEILLSRFGNSMRSNPALLDRLIELGFQFVPASSPSPVIEPTPVAAAAVPAPVVAPPVVTTPPAVPEQTVDVVKQLEDILAATPLHPSVEELKEGIRDVQSSGLTSPQIVTARVSNLTGVNDPELLSKIIDLAGKYSLNRLSTAQFEIGGNTEPDFLNDEANSPVIQPEAPAAINFQPVRERGVDPLRNYSDEEATKISTILSQYYANGRLSAQITAPMIMQLLAIAPDDIRRLVGQNSGQGVPANIVDIVKGDLSKRLNSLFAKPYGKQLITAIINTLEPEIRNASIPRP